MRVGGGGVCALAREEADLLDPVTQRHSPCSSKQFVASKCTKRLVQKKIIPILHKEGNRQVALKFSLSHSTQEQRAGAET